MIRVDENQFEEDHQDNDDGLTNDCPYQIDFSSLEPIVNVPLIELLSDPSIRENVIEFLKNSQDDEPISNYDLNINLEESIIIVSSSPEEGTNKEGDPTNHHQETFIVETLIDKFIEDPFGDQLHCLVEDNSSQCSSHPDLNLDFNHTSEEDFFLKTI